MKSSKRTEQEMSNEQKEHKCTWYLLLLQRLHLEYIAIKEPFALDHKATSHPILVQSSPTTFKMGRMNLGEEIAVAVATMIGASLSFFGSSCIIWNIMRKQKYRKDTYHRLLLGACAFDWLNAIGWFMAPLAPPKDSSPRALSMGNTASCTTQAFLLQIGVAFMIYNACLCVYYLLTIGYNVSQSRMIWRERIMHIVCLIWGIGAAIIPIPMEIYNENGVGNGCWLGRFPQYCETEQNPVPCLRGADIDPALVGYIVAGLPAIASIVIVAVCNIMIYRAARKQGEATRRFAIESLPPNQTPERTRDIAAQATWYVVVFLNSLFWQLLLRFLDAADVITWENESSYTALILLGQFFSSSSGFGFLLVYVRPRYLRYRKKEIPRLTALAVAMSFRRPPIISNGGRQRHASVVQNDNASRSDSDDEY